MKLSWEGNSFCHRTEFKILWERYVQHTHTTLHWFSCVSWQACWECCTSFWVTSFPAAEESLCRTLDCKTELAVPWQQQQAGRGAELWLNRSQAATGKLLIKKICINAALVALLLVIWNVVKIIHFLIPLKVNYVKIKEQERHFLHIWKNG